VISLNLILAALRLGLKNRQVGEKWVSDDCSYLCKGLLGITFFQLVVNKMIISYNLISLSAARIRFKEITNWAKIGFKTFLQRLKALSRGSVLSIGKYGIFALE
jgi:hypothetical protein